MPLFQETTMFVAGTASRYLRVHWPLDGALGTFGSSAVFGLDQQPTGCQVGILDGKWRLPY